MNFDAIKPLALVYEIMLMGESYPRLVHHACHMAPERWLALELAYLANTMNDSRWRAVVERQFVDVMLFD